MTRVPSPSGGFLARPRRQTRGIALILVLALLVLVTVLIVAFLGSISTELQSSNSYASESAARALADSAVNIVISQIQQATTTPTLAWACQPGMIRTYDNTGAPQTAYKLYSSGTLQIGGAFNPIASLGSEVPATWASLTSLYTDLNKPVTAVGLVHYPILDPGAVGVASVSGSGAIALSGTLAPIQGCFLNTSSGLNTVITGTSATQTNPVPMPVQWMYVLKSGSIAAMNPATNTVAGAGSTLADGSKDTIVGRVAFWTDDESCKVNVNTASEGTFWDRPFAIGSYESSLNTSMPVANEFQRFPGHPAMTCLSTIFPNLGAETTQAYNERIYKIVPRIAGGGSQSGSVTVTGTNSSIVPDAQRLFASVDEFLFQGLSPAQASGTTRAVNPSGLGTLFGQADIERTRFFLTTSSRAPEVNLFNKPRVCLWPLQANTTNITDPVDAPNRNAHDKLIAFCSTIGSGTGGTPYYFQRFNTFDQTKIRAAGANYGPAQSPIPSSQSPTLDWTFNAPGVVNRNQSLYTYLQTLTSSPIPGLGGVLGGSGGKYSTPVRDQILTEMMDFIRSELNTFSTKLTPTYTYAPFPASGWVTGESQVVPLVIQPPNASYMTKGFGRISTVTQAALIFYRTDQLVASGPSISGSMVLPDGTSLFSGSGITISEGTPPHMGAVLLLQTYNPTPGPPPWSANVRYCVSGLSTFAVNGTPMTFPDPAINLVDAQENYYDSTALTGLEVCGQYWTNNSKVIGPTTVGAPDEEKHYPLATGTMTLSGTTFNFTGGPITIQIYSGYSNPNQLNTGDLIQTINMNFPNASNLPAPNVVYTQSYSAVTGTTTISSVQNSFTSYNARIYNNGNGGLSDVNSGHNCLPFVLDPGGSRGDTVRAVQARYAGPVLGDYRFIAGLANVPATFFEGHGLTDTPTDNLKYSDTVVTSKAMHSLRTYVDVGNESTSGKDGFFANDNQTTGLTFLSPAKQHARLVAASVILDGNFSGSARPSLAQVAPQGLNGAYMDAGKTMLGDWDNGPAEQIDGPYINKTDEGDSNLTSSSGYYNIGENTTEGNIVETGSSYSPNRQIASAVSFGSLPTGIDPTTSGTTPGNPKPWQTLLFCKNPPSGALHPGFGTPASGPPYTIPPDHAFLDLFTMPIVEPYAISEPFSTAGKVNMNYQMVPFTYVTRDTAVRAVLKSTNIMAIPTTSGSNYKATQVDAGFPVVPPPDFRYNINPDEVNGTLAGFEQRFTGGDIFRSASEICSLYLVPQYLVNTTTPAPGNPTYSTMNSWWLGTTGTSADGYKLTGDNVREIPYGNIYPRLTTKSNTFTVHVWTQTLKKIPGTATNTFVAGQDQILGEYRGSFIVQRYLDPNSDTLVEADGKTPGNENDPNSMVGPYKFRILSSKRFAP